jgi:Stigma-specific protein, Stig1
MRHYLWIWALLPVACAGAAKTDPERASNDATEEGSDGGSGAPASSAGSDAGPAPATATRDAAQPCHSDAIACGGRCVNTNVDPANCGGCGNVCDGGVCSAGSCVASTCTGNCTATVTISNAYIDNVSDLVIQGNAAHWTVLAGDPPGLHGGSHEPTTINGTDWYPTFACAGAPCDSTDTTAVPPLPPHEQTVVLTDWGNGRGGGGTVKITQQPAAPDYVLKLEFSDPPGGASHYHATITYSIQ